MINTSNSQATVKEPSMKQNIAQQLYDYILRTGAPDEEILDIEKKYTHHADNMVELVAFLPFLLIWVLLFIFIPWWMFLAIIGVILAIGIPILAPTLILNRTYLVVTNRAVYFCTGPLASNVYIWTFSEISCVECKQKSIVITSTHRQNEMNYVSGTTARSDWSTLFAYLRNKPVVHQQFSLTQCFALPRSEVAFVYHNLADSARRLSIRFTVGPETSLRDTFNKVAKMHRHIKVEHYNKPID